MHAIAPNTPVTNTATVDYSVGGIAFSTTDSETFTTDSASGNSPPHGTRLGANTIPENQSGGLIGLLLVDDLDPGDTHTFSVDDPRFEIVGGELRLRAGQTLDFETEPAVTLIITVVDSSGGQLQQVLQVVVLDVNETPTDITLDDLTVTAGVVGDVVGVLGVTDPDAGDSHTYIVDDPRFEVVGGQLKLLDSEQLPLGVSVDLLVTVTDAGGLQDSELFTITTTPPGGGSGVNSSVAVYQLATGAGGAQSYAIEPALCNAGSGLQPLANPRSLVFGEFILPASADLSGTGVVKSGDALFVSVSDPDANLDATSVDSVTLEILAGVDVEQLVIFETGADTGIFVGHLQTSLSTPVNNNCSLETGINETVTVRYVDANDPTDIASLDVAVDPFARVFDSASGTLINGAQVQLVQAGSGQTATVFADDGVTQYPAQIMSGDSTLGMPAGAYRFPFVAAGQYALRVTPPNRFNFPSLVADADLQLLPGAPFALEPASRGNAFIVPIGPAVQIDIPLDLQPVAPSDSVLNLLAVQGGSGSQALSVMPAQCFDGAQFNPSGAPVTLSAGVVSVPGIVNANPANRISRGDAVFIKLTDPDQDLNPFAADTVEVLISVRGEADSERIQLLETNDSTGIFVGYVQTSVQSIAQPNNCAVEAPFGAELMVDYVDPVSASDTAQRSVALDPGFKIFSSANGDPLEDVTVTLIDATTGLPASGALFGADGVSAFPATVQSGGTVLDAGGQSYTYAPGSFYFPVIAPGTYRLAVAAPALFQFPSAVADTALNALAGGPYLLVAGSRGGDFTVVAGVPVGFDLPLDPMNADVFITKQASKDVVAVGDFVQYQVRVQNSTSSGTVTGLRLTDDLPPGFRFAPGSLRIGSSPMSDPIISADAANLQIALPQIATGEVVEVRYVVEVTAGARPGPARNRATVIGSAVSSANIAFADVLVREDLLRSKSIIVGQVLSGECGDPDRQGQANVRIWLEDGSFVVTDAQGKFHFENVEPGTHVVHMDSATLPLSHEPAACVENSRFAGSATSQFVDLAAGSLWRANFFISEKPNALSDVVTRLDAEAIDGRVRYHLRVKGDGVPLQKLTATIMLDDKLAYVASSARLGELPKADPSGLDQGVLVFRLPPTAEAFEYDLFFDAAVKQPQGFLTTKSVLQIESASGRQRSEVNVNELSVNWPASLITIAKTERERGEATANGKALARARAKNSQYLPSPTSPAGASDADKIAQGPLAEPAAEPPQAKGPVNLSGSVHEPSRGSNRSQSNVSRTVVAGVTEYQSRVPYQLPELDRGKAPPFDRTWIEANSEFEGIVWPPERYNPPMPAIKVAVAHSGDLRPQLLVDGALVNPLTYEGATNHHELNRVVTTWDGVSISEHDSMLETQLLDQEGKVVRTFTRKVHYSGAPARGEFVREVSYLVADGLYPPVIAVRLYDRAGYPLRPGTTGEFSIGAPYRALDKAKQLENSNSEFANQRYKVLRDGVAYIQLEPTTATGEVEVHFQFDQHRNETIRARLLPGARDWILVGLLEGSYAQNSLSGNLAALDANNLEDESLFDGRAAFYAKGMVKGDWLLTAAYDTDKKFERTLLEQIDPNQFYTLYGDGTEQLHDAQSQRKLYLKLERSRFVSLFGDFDTNFGKSELARYERRINGVNVGYFGDQIEASAFAADTDQAFVREELRGDGTSGVYRLNNASLVRNSEVIRLVTRDRFRTETVIESVTLARFVDYTIDFDRGTLIFKQPVFSQDENFNPIFIEAEYEVAPEGAGKELVAGGRVAYRLDDGDSAFAMTYLDDNTIGQSGDLIGMDLTWQVSDSGVFTVEGARSDNEATAAASAYLIEYEHSSEHMAGRIYAREHEDNFGLGQQSSLEIGTRKFALEGEYRATSDLLINAQAFSQELLSQGTQRQVVETQAQYQLGRSQVRAGIRAIREETLAADDLDARQLTFGATHSLLRNKLLLRGDAELEVGSSDNADYPSRGILGAEYEIFKDVTVLAEQELTWGTARRTQDSRIGLRARPWSGADVNSLVTQQQGENGARLFATTGLLQQWRASERWLFDFGFDRVQTLREQGQLNNANTLLFNPSVPPASGSFNEDFSAFFAGFGYTRDAWNVTSRFELHQGDQADKWNYLVGANHQLDEGIVVSSSLSVLSEESVDSLSPSEHDSIDLRMGFALRPLDSPWTLLNRTDLIYESRKDSSFDTTTAKWVNNFNGNYHRLDSRHHYSVQLGVKYVVDEFDGASFSGLTLLYGGEYRMDLGSRWDIGLRGSALHSLESSIIDYSAGISLGLAAVDDVWVSVGYNVFGFEDADFVAADYTARGVFLKIRMKFDQALAKRFLEFAGVGQSRRMQASGNSR